MKLFLIGGEMFPITIDGKEFTQKEAIEKKIISVCEKHHLEGRAKVFCIMLFDVNDGSLSKVLDDKHYWKSLNAISGRNMTVIYLPSWYSDSKRLKYNNEIEKIFNIDNREGKSIIIVFQVDGNRNILGDYRYFIKSIRIEDIYLEIKGFFDTISDALGYVTKQNEQNYPELFDLAMTNAKTYKMQGIVKKVYNIPLTILSVLSGIKSFV